MVCFNFNKKKHSPFFKTIFFSSVLRSDIWPIFFFLKVGHHQTKIEKESKNFIYNFFVMSFYADAVVYVYFFMSKSFDEQFEFFFWDKKRYHKIQYWIIYWWIKLLKTNPNFLFFLLIFFVSVFRLVSLMNALVDECIFLALCSFISHFKGCLNW